MKFVVVGSQGCLASGFVGLVDFLSLARVAIRSRLKDAPTFDVISVSRTGDDVTSGCGRRLKVDASLASLDQCDVLFVPGFVPDERLQPPNMSGLDLEAEWISRRHSQGTLAYASCSGAYLLGHANLLVDRRCTTTWWLYDEMKRRYPRARTVWGRALVDDRGVVTAGGPLSWVNLALHAIGQLCGQEAARIASDFAVVDTAPSSKADYLSAEPMDEAQAFVLQAERLIRHARGVRFGARELASHLAVSPRTLHRRMAVTTGETVKQFIDRVRVDVARTLLESDNKKVKQVAFEVGFDDEANFRRVFKRVTGTTPGVYREKTLEIRADEERS